MKPVCPYCEEDSKLVSGSDVWPGRSDLYDLKIWECKPCKSRVGCKKNTDIPLGSLANPELRLIRRRAHESFDPIWKSARVSRSKAYADLADYLKLGTSECHIGMMREGMCQRVIDYARGKVKW